MIKLDINIGDIILVGRFKNKRIEVKEFGIDEHGLPTINGRSILKIRVEKLMKTKKNLKMGESKQFSLAQTVKKILKENEYKSKLDKQFKNEHGDLSIIKRNAIKSDNSGPYATTATSIDEYDVVSLSEKKYDKNYILNWAREIWKSSSMVDRKVDKVMAFKDMWTVTVTTTVWQN